MTIEKLRKRGKKKAALAGGFFLFLFGMAETLHALAVGAGHAVKGAGVLVAVVARDVLAEGRVAEVGPVVLVEAGRVLEQGFVDVEHGAVVGGVEGEGVEGDGEILVAQAEKAAERKYGVGNAAGGIDDQIFDLAEVFVLGIDDCGADDVFIGADEIGGATYCWLCHGWPPVKTLRIFGCAEEMEVGGTRMLGGISRTVRKRGQHRLNAVNLR